MKAMLRWIVSWDRRTDAEKLTFRRLYHLPQTLSRAYQNAMAGPYAGKLVGFEAFRHLTDGAWTDTIIKSVSMPIIEGVRFAGFPDESFQKDSVGSANEVALREAGQFYRHVKKYVADQSSISIFDARILDFGVGWGRYARFFARDVKFGNMYGVDVMPSMIEACRITMVPASVSLIEPHGQLPYRDQFFDIVYAYSVFTHLPETVADHWLKEIRRVMRPGGVIIITVEPPRFIDFCRSIANDVPSIYHQSLRDAIARVPDAEARVRDGEFLYLPIGGGASLPKQVYGDAVISETYIRQNWTVHFELVDYLDDGSQFSQAVVVLRNK
jgi:SAM-dependent methyltransferase